MATMATSSQRWPGQRDESFPEVFNIQAMPPQPAQGDRKPGQLPEDMVRHFFDKGYVVIDSFFDKAKLDACRESIAQMVDDLAQLLYDGGKVKNLYKEYGVFQRLSKLEAEFPGANILMMKQNNFPQSFRDVWADPKILNVCEQLIGPDIKGHPVWNLRCKTPQNENTVVPWHQDAGYMDNRSYEVLQVTGWIPLLDATRENGCMEVVSGGHLKGKVATHTCCWRDTWYIMLDEEEMTRTLGVDMEKDVKLCQVPYGGILLINNLIPHRSLPNVSNDIRWSLDLRWQRADKDVGFYDVKPGILMRSRDQPDLQIDWETFMSVSRAEREKELTGNEVQKGDESRYNTLIVGPWMKKWEIVHTNRHTDALTNEPTIG
ncbi:phytanoyl-CoA dioxygenase domain-containing protein 1-like [Babylonia areolata]|uniref:phytanoyl-CoA dioxygenase domain-containing protein 1-like n=1 Tax=Babylonia areolata TaxID=304850 RepID=UPI003FD01760